MLTFSLLQVISYMHPSNNFINKQMMLAESPYLLIVFVTFLIVSDEVVISNWNKIDKSCSVNLSD